jgi:hypothetical protein
MYALDPEDGDRILVVTGNTVRELRDDTNPMVFDGMTGVERAVIVARLREWAIALEDRP